MDDTGNVTQDGQQDVDEEVGIATALKEDTQRWENNGKDDLADIASGLWIARSVRCSSWQIAAELSLRKACWLVVCWKRVS